MTSFSWSLSTSGCGNLLSKKRSLPQPDVESDQEKLVTQLTYHPELQLVASRTNPRGQTTSHEYDSAGNLILTSYPLVSVQPVQADGNGVAPIDATPQQRYAYNTRGQLLRVTHIDGSVTDYEYYPAEDPGGERGPDTATAVPDRQCGYLARVVRDSGGAKLSTGYGYDRFGNVDAMYDGKGNAARLRYNAMGRVELITGREPFADSITYRYDANYDEIESSQAFERNSYDAATRQTTVESTTLRELTEYDALGCVVSRVLAGDDERVKESFVRDADERIVRLIGPTGTVTEQVFDERGLVIEKIGADGAAERFTYTLSGDCRSQADGNGNKTTRHYDGFQRPRGFTDPAGTRKTQWFDEAGNVVRVRVDTDGKALMEAWYHFDQWNRPYRLDQAWLDPLTGAPLGQSRWTGEKGVVSTVVEFAPNGLPGKVWSEAANVAELEYDGAGRLTGLADLTGDAYRFGYDENSNVVSVARRGRKGAGRPGQEVLHRSYDGMDRLESQRDGGNAQEHFRYNALGAVVGYGAASGIEIQHLLDSLGRPAGHAFAAQDASGGAALQHIARRFEYDDDYRLSGYVDARGNRTSYGYDALGRQTSVSFADDSQVRVTYDAAGNAIGSVEPNGDEVVAEYDAARRVVETRSRSAASGETATERYGYDGAGRLVSAVAPAGAVRRRYDSLSRLLSETQGDREVRFDYDAAGNLTSIAYPGGDELHRSYDARNRLTAVHDKAGASVARYSYGATDQVTGMVLGEDLEAALSYDPQQRLESIDYRSRGDGRHVEGFRYGYDAAGRMTHEIQSGAGPAYGERYVYDDAARATRAQYGVEDVFDPASAFERETSYEHFPDDGWSRRVDVDGGDRSAHEDVGSVDERNRYRRLGDSEFTHDANGNCVRKGVNGSGYWVYSYDVDKQLVKAEHFDARGRLTQTIEYFYDALGRLVRKLLTDEAGVATEFQYVWAGSLLIEEYENGVLVRSYLHGVGATPVQLSSYKNGRSDFTYVFNGRGLASGLVGKDGTNRFAEKYIYELTGNYFVKEIGGRRVGLPDRSSTVSSLANSLLSSDPVGSLLADWESRTIAGGGRHLDPAVAAVLNGVGSGHGGVKGALGAQLRGWLGALGLGGHGTAPPAKSKQSAHFTNPKMSLYASGENTPFNFGYTPPSVSQSKGGATPKDSRVQFLQDLAAKPFSAGPIEGTVGGVAAGVVNGLGAGMGNPAKAAPPPPGPQLTEGEKQAELKKQQDAQKEKEEKEQREKEEKAKKEREEKEKKDKEEKDKKKYVNPDADTGAQWTMPSPLQVEAKLNQTKRPVNPDGGAQGPQVDTSSPPPRFGGVDPTIAYFDGESGAGILSAFGTPKVTIAPIDYVRGHEPLHVDHPPVGGTSPNTGRPMP